MYVSAAAFTNPNQKQSAASFQHLQYVHLANHNTLGQWEVDGVKDTAVSGQNELNA